MRYISLDEINEIGMIEKDSFKGGLTNSDLQPTLNPLMRYPLPAVTNVSPDALRQYYRGGQLPQVRVLAPPTMPINGALGNTTVNSNVINSSSSSSALQLRQTAITTPVLSPNQSFNATVALGKVFQIFGVACSIPARVELYSTLNALQIDAFRELDVAPAYGVEFGLILDVALDTDPLNMPLEGISGNNGDAPQASLCYISITNIGQSSNPITVTISYLPLIT